MLEKKSPITNGKVKIVQKIPVSLILGNIKKQYGYDMSESFKGITEISVLECEEIGYRFYYPFPEIDEEQFYNKTGRQEAYYPQSRWEFSIALEFMRPNDNILEIGSGYGGFLDILSNKGFSSYQGIELNQKAIEVIRNKGYKITDSLIQNFSQYHNEEFDIVCMFQVLEHINDVDSFIRNCLKVLKKNGKLIIAVPNNDAFVMQYDYLSSAGNLPPHHIGLWREESLKKIGIYYGLKLISVEKETLPSSLLGYYYTLKMKKILGNFANLIVFPTRWLIKLFFKGKTNKILGPSILIVFQK